MEANNKRGDNRERIICFRLCDPEIRDLDRLKEKYGLTRSDLIRKFLLEEKGPLSVNLKESLEVMSELAAEQGRANNNINQLARHANQSLRPTQSNPTLFARSNEPM